MTAGFAGDSTCHRRGSSWSMQECSRGRRTELFRAIRRVWPGCSRRERAKKRRRSRQPGRVSACTCRAPRHHRRQPFRTLIIGVVPMPYATGRRMRPLRERPRSATVHGAKGGHYPRAACEHHPQEIGSSSASLASGGEDLLRDPLRISPDLAEHPRRDDLESAEVQTGRERPSIAGRIAVLVERIVEL